MGIDNKKVEEIARNFLQQHHDVKNIKVAGIKNGIWFVEWETRSSSGERARKLRIDGETGEIISVE